MGEWAALVAGEVGGDDQDDMARWRDGERRYPDGMHICSQRSARSQCLVSHARDTSRAKDVVTS